MRLHALLQGAGGGSLATIGSPSTGPIAATTEYEVICTGPGGAAKYP